MKKINRLMLSTFIMIILISCSRTPLSKYINFDFHPGLPYESKIEMIKTKVFLDNTLIDKMKIGVIAGFDAHNNKFVVLALTKEFAGINVLSNQDKAANVRKKIGDEIPIDALNLNFACMLSLDKLEELLQLIDSSIDSWDKILEEDVNEFFRFYLYPEFEEISFGEDVIQFSGTFKYEYQNSALGSVVHIIFAAKRPLHRTIDEKETIMAFRKVLLEAKNYLDSVDESELIGNE